LLQAAAAEHGSIQAAVIAGLHALRPEGTETSDEPPDPLPTSAPGEALALGEPDGLEATDTRPGLEPDDEITAGEAAELLGLKANTIRGYIRTGRLPGRYDAAPDWRGWLVNRQAVTEYAEQRT
jgi:excisionase family DNA binding protein